MCCEITEDCTNNKDDNLNNWTDFADNNVKTAELACAPGIACGVSDAIEFEECQWLNDYCVGDDCDFKELGLTQGYGEDLFLVEVGYAIQDYYNNSCIYIHNYTETPILSTDAFGSDLGCAANHNFTLSANLNATAILYDIGQFELINRCLFFHCSGGQNDTLPPWTDDMVTDSVYTKHVCPTTQYWRPDTGSCVDFSECYLPSSPLLRSCKNSYELEFDDWFGDFNNAVDPDCFKTTGATTSGCCPVFKAGVDTYDYVDLTYFVHP